MLKRCSREHTHAFDLMSEINNVKSLYGGVSGHDTQRLIGGTKSKKQY